MSDGFDMSELMPTSTAPQVAPPGIAPPPRQTQPGFDLSEIAPSGPAPLPADLSTLHFQVPQEGWSVIARTPDPAKTRDQVLQSIEVARGLGIPFTQAFQYARSMAASPAPKVRGLFPAIASEYKANQIQTRINEAGFRMIDEGVTPELVAERKSLEAQLPDAKAREAFYQSQGFLGKMAIGGAGLVGQMQETIAGKPNQDLVIGALYDPTLSPGQRAARLFAAGMSPTLGTGRQEAGGALLEYLDAGIPYEIAKPVAQWVGRVNNALEIAGDVVFLGMFRGAKMVAQRALGRVAQKAVYDTGLKAILLRLAGKAVGGFAAEMGTEYLQEIDTWLGRTVATETAQEQGLTPDEAGSLKDRLAQLTEQAGPGMLALSLLPAVAEGWHSYRDVVSKTTGAITGVAEKALGGAPTVGRVMTKDIDTLRQGIIDTNTQIGEALKAQEEGGPPVDTAPHQAKLEQHVTEIDAAMEAKANEIGTAPEMTDAPVRELLDLADMKDAVQQTIREMAPPDTTAETAGVEQTPQAEAPPAGEPTATTPPPTPAITDDIRAAIRQNLPQFSEREVTAAGLVVDFRAKREGMDTPTYVAERFAPGVFSAPETAQATVAGQPGANAAVTFLEDGKAIVHAVEQTDFKALVHEFVHVFGRHLSPEETASVQATFGTGIQAEERFAEAMIRFWQTGETEHAALAPLMTELADLLRGARTQFDDVIPVETKRVFDGMLAQQDTINTQRVEAGQGQLFNTAAWHGTKTVFDRFDPAFMGTGEGAQAYGWGTYVAQEEGTARHYADAVTPQFDTHEYRLGDITLGDKEVRELSGGVPRNWTYILTRDIESIERATTPEDKTELRDILVADLQDEVVHERRAYDSQWRQAATRNLFGEDDIARTMRMLEAQQKVIDHIAAVPADQISVTVSKPKRVLYGVTVNPEGEDVWLDWNGKVTEPLQQTIIAQAREENISLAGTGLTEGVVVDEMGQTLYRDLSKALGGDRKASEFLDRAGITGMRIPQSFQQRGRAAGAPYNYAVFNPAKVQIKNTTLFNPAPSYDPAAYDEARQFSSPDEYAAMASTMDMDPKPEEEYRRIWQEAKVTPPDRTLENTRFVESISTKEGMNALLMDLWRAEDERPQLPTMDVHKLLKDAVAKAPHGISDAAYAKLMDQIRDDPTRYRGIVARVLGDDEMANQIAREREIDPTAAALEKAKETNRELRRTNKTLTQTVGAIEKSLEKQIRGTTREQLRADMATEKAKQIAERAGAAQVTAKLTTADLLDQIREEQQAQETIITQAKDAYAAAVREGKAAVVATKQAQVLKAEIKLAAIKDKMIAAVDEQKQRLKDYKDALATKQYVAKLVKAIKKQPGTGVQVDVADQIREIQDSIDTSKHRQEAVAKLQEKLRAWQAANPGKQLPPLAQRVMNQRNVRDMTVAELEGQLDAIKKLREAGIRLRAVEVAERDVRRGNTFRAALAAIGGPVEKIQERGSEPANVKKRKLERKNQLRVAMGSPIRLFEMLDGTSGVGKESGPWKDFLWQQRKAFEGKEVVDKLQWDAEIAALYKARGLKPVDLVRWLTMKDGTKVNAEVALYMYGAMQDRHSRLAVLGGNVWTVDRVNELIKQLKPAEKAWMDGVIDLFDKSFSMIRQVRARVDNENTVKVDRYIPIRRETDVGQPYDQELGTENNVRAGLQRASTAKGMLKSRVDIKMENQPPTRTDLMNLLSEAVNKQTHYVAAEEWARDAQWLASGKSKESKILMEAVRQKYGNAATDAVKNYVNLVIRPSLWNAMEAAHLMNQFGKFLYKNLGKAQLMFKLSTIVKQVEGPVRALGTTDPLHVMAGIAQATVHPVKTLDFVYEKSPGMRRLADSRAIDPILSAMREAATAKTKAGRAWQMYEKIGFAGLQAMNAWTIGAEWTAVYNGEMAKMEKAGTVDEAQAIAKADESCYRHQPSGELADRAPIYWTNDRWVAFALRFTNATVQMLDMVAYDIPQAVKEHHVARAVGIVSAFAFGNFIAGAVRRKRLPKDGMEVLEDSILGIGNLALGLGDTAASAILGKRTFGQIDPFAPIGAASRVIRNAATGRDLTSKEVWDLASTTLEYLGVATPAVENIARSTYDWEEETFRFDPRELFGRVPKGE